MENSGWKYSAWFKLYGKDGLQVSFTINGEDGATHQAEMGDYITTLLSEEGFTISPEGVKPGEKIQEVDGWVLGETSEGQQCIHLYKSPLQWKVATVYEERIKDIPITVSKSTFQWPGAAPEREAADRRNAINPCNFSIILIPTGKTSEKGNPILKFDRVIGFSPAGGTKSNKASDVQSYADLFNLLKDESKKLAEWCREKQKSEKPFASGMQVQTLCEEIDNINGDKGTGEIVLEILTGVPAPELVGNVKSYVINGLTKWISPFVTKDKKTVENPDRRPAMVESIKLIWGMAHGYNEVNKGAEESSPSSRSAARGKDQMQADYNDSDIPF